MFWAKNTTSGSFWGQYGVSGSPIRRIGQYGVLEPSNTASGRFWGQYGVLSRSIRHIGEYGVLGSLIRRIGHRPDLCKLVSFVKHKT